MSAFAVLFPAAAFFATLDNILSRIALLLVLLGLVAYGGALAGAFHLDDYALLNSPDITTPAGLAHIWAPLATRPLTNTTFWLNYLLGGDHPAGYLAVDLALHFLAAWLLYDALRRTLPSRAAAVAAAVFLLHPIQAEAVNYIFERATLLACVLCLASLRSWLIGARWPAVAWFAAALLAKEECVAFPLLLALLEIAGPRRRRAAAPIAAMLLASLLAGARVLAASSHAGSGAGASSDISTAPFLLAQGAVILRYLRMLVLPYGFTVDPQISIPSLETGLLAWLAVAALAALAALAWRRGYPAGLWFLAGILLLLPSSSVFPASDLAADRRLYLPMIAFAASAGLLLQSLDGRILFPGLALLALLSLNRTLVWRTEESLWSDAVRKAPSKLRPLIQLARASPPDRAIPLLERAESLAPSDPRPASEMGRVFLASGNPALALAAFGRALALAPSDPLALNNRGAALLALGQSAAARLDFEHALRLAPCQFNALANLRRMGVAVQPPAACRFTPAQAADLGEKANP